MKIPAHIVEEMRTRISKVDNEQNRDDYRNGRFPLSDRVEDLNKCYRWDLFWATGGTSEYDIDWSSIKDAHIDTALRQIVSPL